MSGLSIEARELCKHYELAHGQAKKAVDNVSFRLAEGERLGVIGRNGAGKTTLLQLLAGISGPTGGRLDIHGKVTAIFTLAVGLRDDLTGRENIYIEGELQGRSRQEIAAKIDEIVDFAELAEFIDRPVRTYSTGMKARLAFSTIVHVEPEILIIDEALSVGDARFSAKATRKMKELTRRGRILILVSHAMAAVTDMCTRCIWMDQGTIRLDGAPAEVTEAYLEEVRRTDDALLTERFRREIVHEQCLPGWDVEALAMHSSEGIESAGLVTGEPASLVADLACAPGATLRASVRVERLDGLVVVDSRSPAGPALRADAAGRARLRLDFGLLRLNHGFYRALLEVHGPGGLAARRSTLFEVSNPRPHPGGRPVLAYPAALQATPLTP
jgi:lipopolysaccharide transport system ATP-binding protein